MSKHIERLQLEIAAQTDSFAEPQASSDVYIFFSYDLVNSTRYKTQNKKQWPLVIHRFYQLIEDGSEKWISHARLWKYGGDEVLLYKRLLHISDLHNLLTGAHKVMTKAIDRLHQEFSDTKTILSVKATLWCAKTLDIPPQDSETLARRFPDQEDCNIILHADVESDDLDFLGPDIDLGFRISKYALRKRMVLSADLAYLLYKEGSAIPHVQDQLKIVAYESLKGIWEGRRYPIIWYEQEWRNIKSSFLYDEHFESELITQILQSDLGGDDINTMSILNLN